MAPPKPRLRKRKVRARLKSSSDGASHANSNVDEIIPETKSEREERRQSLKAELAAQRSSDARVSSKKRKRLEKYVDNKLKREDNIELIKKLERQEIDTSLLKSSKKLGRRRDDRREAARDALLRERAGLPQLPGKEDALYARRHQPVEIEQDDIDADNLDTAEAEDQPSRTTTTAAPLSTSFGSGLKRPLPVDDQGNPMVKRKRQTKARQKIVEPDSSEWEGFDSGEDFQIDAVSSDQIQTSVGDSSEEEQGYEDHDDDDDDDGNGTDSQDDGSFDSDSAVSQSSATGGEDDSDEDVDTEESRTEKQERASAFKQWANQQHNKAIGFTPSATQQAASQPQALRNQVVNPILKLSNRPKDPNIFHVDVTRDPSMQETRSALPVFMEEQRIMEAIRSNDITIICGATGSGKTTQVPQFLYEAGYGAPNGPTPGMVGITQPRRVAAVSMAKRVGQELGDASDKVGHQIRFDSTVSPKTAVKFMTDGVLLRELSQDFLLSKYSALVIDEAHERSVNTDILIGMLSRVTESRRLMSEKSSKHKPLKLIIMSATLRVQDFTENKSLFRSIRPPLIEAEGRQHPVTVHFARRTTRNYLDELFEKVSRGHRKLPPGGMLVFLTGQNEITHLVKRLRDAYPSKNQVIAARNPRVRTSAAEAQVEAEDVDYLGDTSRLAVTDAEDSDLDIRGVDNEDEDGDDEFQIGDEAAESLKVHVLPLYSQLPTEQQMKIFQAPPEGSRLIVVSTNVAETSLTIPGIRYVFDCGRSKEKIFDEATGVQSFEVDWISKASALQRSGRAGRTGPGHCYRLYSSAVYERDFPEFSIPEIQKTPIEGVVLQLKTMGIPNVSNFPFPTPPSKSSLQKAERLLEFMGAIDSGKITDTGKQLSQYPLSPRLSRMLLLAQSNKCIEHAIAMVSILSVSDVFIPEPQISSIALAVAQVPDEDASAQEGRRKGYGAFHSTCARFDQSSDAIKLLTLFTDFLNARSAGSDLDSFRTYTRVKALSEAVDLRSQLTAIIAAHRPEAIGAPASNTLPYATSKQVKTLKQILAAGYIDKIAIRADLSPSPPNLVRKAKKATDYPYITLFPSSEGLTASNYGTSQPSDRDEAVRLEREKFVYVHPSSLLAHITGASLPQYLVYSQLSKAAPSQIGEKSLPRTRLHPLTSISAAQIVALARGTPLLEEGRQVGKTESLARNDNGEERRTAWIVPYIRGKVGDMGWPLPPARKVSQRRDKVKGWITESVLGESS